MDINKNSKWSKLRGRLHMLGYNQDLGEESAPLVEQLFSDLVHTTESLREFQRSADKSEKESQNSDVRLARENQEIHLDLMMSRGEKARVIKELRVHISKLDEDLAFLKSLNEQYLREIHSREKDCKEKARLIRKLRQKNLNVEVQAVDGNHVIQTSPHAASPPDDSDTADLLQGELRKLKTQLGKSQGHIQHLNNQIHDLQETNDKLKEKLKEVQQKSSSRVAEITSKNHELCQEITVIRNLAKKLELDKKQKLEEAEIKSQELRVIIRKLQGVNKDLEAQLSKNRMTSDLPDDHEQESRTDPQNDIHNDSSDRELLKSQLGNELEDLKEQNDKFEAMVEFLAAEKSRLEDKVQKMMSVEKVLVLELEGWRTKYGICGMDRLPSRLDDFVKSLEEERNHYRQEAEHYKNIRNLSSRSPERQSSRVIEHPDYPNAKAPDEIRNLREQLRLVEENLQHVTKEKVSLMEELKKMQLQREALNLNMSEKIPKEEHKLSEERIRQAKKDALEEELRRKQLQPERRDPTTSAENLDLKTELRLAEEKTQLLTAENNALVEKFQKKQQLCEQHTEELYDLKKQLKLAEEKVLQLTGEKDVKIKELKQMQEQHAASSSEIPNLKEELRLAKRKIPQGLTSKDPMMEELNQMRKQNEKQQSEAFAEISKLKKELQQAEDKLQRLTSEKGSLMEEFKQKQLQYEKHDTKKSAEMFKLEKKIKEAEDKLQQVKSEKDTEMEESKQIQRQHDEQQSKTSAEIVKLEEKLRLAEEKIRQATKEKDGPRATQKSSSSNSDENSALKEKLGLAEQRIQTLTEEIDSLKEELKQKNSSVTSDEISNLKEKLRRAEEKNQQLTEENDKQEVELQNVDPSANSAAEVLQRKVKLRQAEEKIQQLSEEKGKQEDGQLQNVDPSANSAAEVLQRKVKHRQAEEKIQQLSEENGKQEDGLQNVDPSANSAAEVLQWKMKLRQAEEKIQQLSEEKGKQEDGQLQHVDPAAEVHKLREKLRLAEEKIQRVTSENNSLREQLKGGLTSPLPHGCEQEIRILDLQNAIHNLEQEKLELRSQIFALRDRELDARSAALVQNAEATERQRQVASSLRRQQQQIQDAIMDLQQLLSIKNDELQSAHSQMEHLKVIIESLSQEVCQHKQEAEALRISFSALCIKRDVLQEDVVTKTRRLAVLQEQLCKKLEVEQKSRERELATQKILETHQEALLRLTRENELITGEYRRLQDDVAAVTQEKQAAQVKMEEALCEREELKQRVHSYVNTVSRIENILKTKDEENLNLAERFRIACSDVQEREQQLQQLNEFIGSVRLELLSSETERKRLHEALGHKERDIEQHMQDLQTYKTQAATFAQGLSQLEEEVRVLQEEKASLIAELASVREVCVKMDSDKEIAAQQLLHTSMELERATTRQDDALTEAALLKEHVASEKLAVRNMEAVLSASRQEMFQAHQAASEKEAELRALRLRLTVADNKILVHAREVTNLRAKVTQLQTKMEVLSSKVLGHDALQDTPSQDISFRPLRASSPVDQSAAPRRTPRDSSDQEEEFRFGLT
ncbi:uncharacterized protein LOC144026505 isoform X3 [Festucalex cinctus]